MTHAGQAAQTAPLTGPTNPRAAGETGRTAIGLQRRSVVHAELVDQAIQKTPAGESLLVKSMSMDVPVGGLADKSAQLGLSAEVQADKSKEGQEGVAEGARALDPAFRPVIGSALAVAEEGELTLVGQDRPMDTAGHSTLGCVVDQVMGLLEGGPSGQTVQLRDSLHPSSAAQLVEVGDTGESTIQGSAQLIRSSLGPVEILSTAHAAGWAPISELGGSTERGQSPLDAPPQVDTVEPCMEMTTYVAAPCNVAQALVGGVHANREETPTDVTAKELVALGNIKSFCAGLLKKLAPPLLKEIEGARGVRPGQDPFTPRRTTRSVLNSVGARKTKATVAKTVLLKALGVASEDLAVSEDTLGVLRSVFDSPLQEQQLKAIAAIFGKSVPTNLAAQMESAVMTVA